MIPDVTAIPPADLAAGSPHHQNRVDIRAFFQRFIDIGLQRDFFAATHSLVCGNDRGGFTIQDAPGNGFRRETAENNRMHGADPGAGQHRVGGLGDHRHINGHQIALFNAPAFQNIGETADIFIKLAIGDFFGLSRVIALPDDGDVILFFRQVAVDAICTSVQGSIFKPADFNVSCKIHVLDFGKRLDPGDALAVLGPERFRVINRFPVQCLILVLGAPGMLEGRLLDRDDDILAHKNLQNVRQS